eukprot:m.89300 g.89300  ORF g.89300 m.89300 type:complete len:89 (+) comp11731_c0_seq1:511-777(+)
MLHVLRKWRERMSNVVYDAGECSYPFWHIMLLFPASDLEYPVCTFNKAVLSLQMGRSDMNFLTFVIPTGSAVATMMRSAGLATYCHRV